MNIVEASMKHRQITLLVTCLLVAVGVYSLMHMARREDPKMTIRQGLIIMTYPGAKAIRVEEQVTKKIEAYLFRYEEVKKDETESRTSDGLSIIQVELQGWVKNRDKFWSKLRHDLYELKAASLPSETVGPVVNSDFGDTIALLIAVESDRHSYTELKDYIEIIEDELRPLLVVSPAAAARFAFSRTSAVGSKPGEAGWSDSVKRPRTGSGRVDRRVRGHRTCAP